MEKDEKLSGEIALKSPFLHWLDNFWYHYKWPVIGIALALIILLVCVLQTCTSKKADTLVVYAGPTYLLANESEQISQLLTTLAPYDADDNGENLIPLNAYEIYSEDQIRAFETNHPGQAVDRSRNQSQYQNYLTYQQTGQSCVYLLDPWLYEVIDREYLCSLSESLGALPEGAMADGYGVRLGDTALYREYGVMRLLPEDTVICLMNPFFLTKSWDEEAYDYEKALFEAIVTYGGAEESGS